MTLMGRGAEPREEFFGHFSLKSRRFGCPGPNPSQPKRVQSKPRQSVEGKLQILLIEGHEARVVRCRCKIMNPMNPSESLRF